MEMFFIILINDNPVMEKVITLCLAERKKYKRNNLFNQTKNYANRLNNLIFEALCGVALLMQIHNIS